MDRVTDFRRYLASEVPMSTLWTTATAEPPPPVTAETIRRALEQVTTTVFVSPDIATKVEDLELPGHVRVITSTLLPPDTIYLLSPQGIPKDTCD